MALALDPSGGVVAVPSATSSSFTITLSTTNFPDVIIAAIYIVGGTSFGSHHVTSISSANVTWDGAARAIKTNTTDRLEIWKGVASAALSSEVITVNLDASIDQTGFEGHAWGVSGANTGTPFDSNGALPVVGTTSDVLINTSNANDFCFAFYLTASASATAGAGWTQITSRVAFSEFKIVAATQTNLDATLTGDTVTLGIGDAIVQAGAAASKTPFNPWPQLGPTLAQKRKALGWAPLSDHRWRRWRK